MKKFVFTLLISFLIMYILAGCSESKIRITKLDDLKNVSIGAMTGTTGEQLAKKRFPNATIKSFDDIMDAVAALKSNQIDAVITGFPAAMNCCKHNSDLQYLSEPVDYENTAIAVRKGNEKLLAELNNFISELKTSGTLKDMRRRWFKTDLAPYEKVEITLPTKGEVLKIGTSATREPFCFVDANRNVTGHDGELSRRISAKLGRPIEFVDMKFSALIPALQSGKVDMIVAGMTATAERRKSVDFSESYFENSQVIIVKKSVEEKPSSTGNSVKLKSIDDIKDKRIGVLLGSVHDTYAMKNYPNATVLQYKSPSELILAVRSGKVDAAMYTHETLQEILRADNDLTLLGDTLFSVPIAMGFNKSNGALREKFNVFLKKINNDGTFNDMVNRWVKNGTTEMPEIKNPKPDGSLVVGMVSDKGLPFTIVKNNKLIGFDVELVERFAAYLGKTPKIVDMEFGSLIAAVSTNKIEMIASTLMITDERKKQIDFSDQYMRLGASIFTLKKNIDLPENTKLKKLDDIANRKIGVYEGTINDAFIASKYPQAEIKRFDSSADMILALKAKRIDAAFLDLISARIFLKSENELGILADKAFEKPLGIGFNKNNPDLRRRFNEFLKSSKADGSFDQIYKRWCIDNTNKVVIPVEKTGVKNSVLKLGVSAVEDLPYVAFIEGKFVGLDIELIQKFAEKINRKLDIVTMDFPALFAALTSGKVDMIADGLAITDERQKQIDFSDSYMDYKAAVIALKENIEIDNPEKLNTLDDIANRSVGVYAGSIHDVFVQTHYPQADIKQFTTVADMVLALKTKKLEVALFDLCAAKVLLKSNPDIGILTDNVLDLPVGYGFNKNNPALREKFNKFLKTAKSDGTYDAIYKRWFVEDPEKAQMPVIEFDKNARPITLGVAVGDLPNSAIINNEHVGFDIELLKTFAKREGFNMKIITMEFSSLVAALASGKVDMIADGIAITKERQKQVDFSDPYNELQTAVLALKTNIAGFDINKIDEGSKTPSSISSFFSGIVESFHNNIILEKRYLLILDGLKTTVIISLLSILFGTMLGSLICFMRMSRRNILRLPAKLYISILRGTPVLVILMLIFYVVFASVDIEPAIVAVIAFGLNFAAYVSEMYRTGIEGVDKGQTEAGIAMGFTKVKTFIYIVLPQAARRILPVYKGEVISLVKMTSIVGYIAVQDLTKASDIIRSRTFDAFFPLIMVAVLYFLIAWLLMIMLGFVERKSNPKLNLKRG
jgi:polar amino acid transport system substrate-binding protein